jgi:hypothetical protein
MYNKLSKKEKKKVTNYNILKDAKKTLEEAENDAEETE